MSDFPAGEFLNFAISASVTCSLSNQWRISYDRQSASAKSHNANPHLSASFQISAPSNSQNLKLAPPSNKRLPSLPPFDGRVLRQQTIRVLVMFNYKQVNIDSFRHCTLTVAMDGSEDLLIHCLNPNQPCPAALLTNTYSQNNR